MMAAMRTRALLLASVLLAALASSTQVDARSMIHVYLPVNFAQPDSGVQGPLHRPRRVTIASADSGLKMRRLRWHGWGTARVSATGISAWCSGSCSNGTHWAPIELRFSHPVPDCGGGRWFAHLTIREGGGRAIDTPVPNTNCAEGP